MHWVSGYRTGSSSQSVSPVTRFRTASVTRSPEPDVCPAASDRPAGTSQLMEVCSVRSSSSPPFAHGFSRSGLRCWRSPLTARCVARRAEPARVRLSRRASTASRSPAQRRRDPRPAERPRATSHFSVEDIPHSFTIDDDALPHQQARRAGQARLVRVPRRRVGTIPVLLQPDDRRSQCKEMQGTLIVDANKPFIALTGFRL